MSEIWKKVDDSGNYEVSNLGRVRSKDRVLLIEGANRPYRRFFPGAVLQPFISKSTGYLQVEIGYDRKNVHRLVALAFCDGYQDGLVVNHKNGIRDDNRAENLEWITHRENIIHAYTDLGRGGSCLGRFSEDHPASKAVVATNMKTGKKRIYLSAMDAVREGFSSSSISRCCSGKYAHHKKHYWRFANDEDIRAGGVEMFGAENGVIFKDQIVRDRYATNESH